MSNIKFTDHQATQDHNPPPEFSQQDFIGLVFGGKYKIVDEISKGGMGRIFKAEQLSLNRNVALKVVLGSDEQEANQRFLLEASLTASLDHPNIVKIFDFGRTDDGILFLVMELLSGQDLKSWVKEYGPLSISETIQMAKHLCGALSEAHRHNVIHRDIKPTNIMISKKPGAGLVTKLIDFGLVKNVDQTFGVSKSGMLLGTPMYMSPEQITAQGVDDRADIYAIGLTIYYALTGKIPYPKRGLNSLMHAHLSEDLPLLQDSNPSISESHMINWILKSAVAKKVEDRFQNTLQMLEALEICERFNASLLFPQIELVDGSLRSTDDSIEIDQSIPQHPLVNSGSYVGDGSSISDEFANTLSLEIECLSSAGPGFESVSKLGPHSLMQKPAAISQPVDSSGVNPADSQRVQKPTKLVWVPVVVLILLGVYTVLSLNPDPVPVVSQISSNQSVHTVVLDSVPSGADLFIDETISGSTPATLKLKSKETLNIKLILDGYEVRTFTISEQNQEEMVIQLRPVESVPKPSEDQPVRKSPPKQKASKKPKISSKPRVSPKPIQEKKKQSDTVKSKKKGELKETEWD